MKRYLLFSCITCIQYTFNQELHYYVFQKRWPTTHVVLITPPPIDEDGRLRWTSYLFCFTISSFSFFFFSLLCVCDYFYWGLGGGWWENRYPFPGDNSGIVERTNKSAGTYAKACLAVASECKIPAIDLWTKMQNIPGWQKACLRYSHSLHFFCFQFSALHNENGRMNSYFYSLKNEFILNCVQWWIAPYSWWEQDCFWTSFGEAERERGEFGNSTMSSPKDPIWYSSKWSP